MLEVGLIKLIEMRSVLPVEKILERLAMLEQKLSGGQSGPTPEKKLKKPTPHRLPLKKTLSFRTTAEDIADELLPVVDKKEPPVAETQSTTNVITSTDRQAYDPGFLESIRLALPDIDSEALEHAEDSWLDSAYDEKLLRSGDDLNPIKNAAKIVETALGRNSQVDAAVFGGTSKTPVGTAAAPAREKTLVEPVLDVEQAAEIPTLSETSNEEELFAYASAHPVVRKALRIFRGKLVEVKNLAGTFHLPLSYFLYI